MPLLARLRGHDTRAVTFRGPVECWDAAESASVGYDATMILERVLAATLRVKRGEAAFERDSVTFEVPEYQWPLLSMLFWSAARHGGELSVLDFGGALGSTYFQNRRFLQSLPRLSWTVVEQSHFVRAGTAHIAEGPLTFADSASEVVARINPNLLLLSGVLGFVRDPLALLRDLLAHGVETVIVDRTFFLREPGPSRIMIEDVPAWIYPASYPCWFLEEAAVRDVFAQSGYVHVQEFEPLDRLDPPAVAKGHVFRLAGLRAHKLSG